MLAESQKKWLHSWHSTQKNINSTCICLFQYDFTLAHCPLISQGKELPHHEQERTGSAISEAPNSVDSLSAGHIASPHHIFIDWVHTN